MPSSDTHDFLEDLDKKLWNAADRLRSNLDAAASSTFTACSSPSD